MFERKMILIIFITTALVIPGSVLGSPLQNTNVEPVHKPAYINSVDDLVKVHVEPRLSPAHPQLPTITDVNIIQLISQLNETLILKYLENLTAFGPRKTGTEACDQAAHYLYETFKNMGLAVLYKNYTDSAASGSNIEATLLGRSGSNIFIICGHYDSVSNGPGADDDGSGVAAVLAAADLMSHYSFNNTVKFVAFSGEEQGLVGSRHYVQDAYNSNETIVAVLNADMIGYTSVGSDGHEGKIYENPASEWIVNFTEDISQLYTDYINIQLFPQGETWGSDHYYFWQFGYDAVFYHEFHFNDYYHSSNDTIAHMNLTYSTRFSRLILATLASMAQQPRPVLEINNISGGLGINWQITNLGDADALNAVVSIQITGGVLKLINIVETVDVPILEPLQILPMHTKLFRLGQISITITATAPNANQVTRQATAFALGPLILRTTILP